MTNSDTLAKFWWLYVPPTHPLCAPYELRALCAPYAPLTFLYMIPTLLRATCPLCAHWPFCTWPLCTYAPTRLCATHLHAYAPSAYTLTRLRAPYVPLDLFALDPYVLTRLLCTPWPFCTWSLCAPWPLLHLIPMRLRAYALTRPCNAGPCQHSDWLRVPTTSNQITGIKYPH